jgi:hypothetical protein
MLKYIVMKNISVVGSEVLTAVAKNSSVFWGTSPCSPNYLALNATFHFIACIL